MEADRLNKLGHSYFLADVTGNSLGPVSKACQAARWEEAVSLPFLGASGWFCWVQPADSCLLRFCMPQLRRLQLRMPQFSVLPRPTVGTRDPR
jgi:hypothetical protein